MKLESIKNEDSLKARWVAALRSGEYKQCTVSLKKSGAYCSLGVLCDIVDHNAWMGEYKQFSEVYEYGRIERLIGKDTIEQLITMNDKEGKSFVEIADYIEANLDVAE